VQNDNAVLVKTKAKINIYLEIENKRPDGFHNIYSLFLPINWEDSLYFYPLKEGFEFFSSDPALCENNTITKAAALLEPFKKNAKGIRVYLDKKVPYQAGLGSASANGTGALLYLNQYWECGLSQKKLHELAEQISSDSPFFLYHSPAVVTGRGEKIDQVKTTGGFGFIVLKPKDQIVSTREAYEQIARQNAYTSKIQQRAEMLEAFTQGDVETFAKLIFNGFETVLEKKYPYIAESRKIFKELGALNSVLSGSGSSVVGVFRDTESLNQAESRFFQENFQNIFDFKKTFL